MVLDSGKSSQPILVDVYSERITRGHQHIDAKVKLESINNEGL